MFVLTVRLQDIYKLAEECQIVLDIAATRADEGDGVTTETLYDVQNSS